MNKNQLTAAVAKTLGSRRTAAKAVDAVLDAIVRAVVEGDPVSVTGFGAFEPVTHAPHKARNPQTGETVAVPATTRVRFRPGRSFADMAAGRKPLPASGSAAAKAPKGTYSNGK